MICGYPYHFSLSFRDVHPNHNPALSDFAPDDVFAFINSSTVDTLYLQVLLTVRCENYTNRGRNCQKSMK